MAHLCITCKRNDCDNDAFAVTCWECSNLICNRCVRVKYGEHGVLCVDCDSCIDACLICGHNESGCTVETCMIKIDGIDTKIFLCKSCKDQIKTQ